MQKCPRCQYEIEGAAQAACPICFTSLAAQPPAAPQVAQAPAAAMAHSIGTNMPAYGSVMHGAQPIGQPASPPMSQPYGARVSLTGEVIAAGPSASVQQGLHYGGGTGAMNSTMPIPSVAAVRAAPRTAYRGTYQKQEAVRDNSRRNQVLINLSVLFVFLGLCGGGGWWKWTHRTNPKSQVERYTHAIQWLDWGVVYELSATPPGNMSRREFLDKMDERFDNNGVLRIVGRHANEAYHFNVSEPTITGDNATVAVTISNDKMGETRSVEFKLKNFGGVWKIYPLSANPSDLL